MSAPVFLAERKQLLAGDDVHLAGHEARHAATVRRLAPGERVDLTDGAGLFAECVVKSAGRDELSCVVRSRRELAPPRPRVHVVQALTKGDGGERAVEMMTEAGVDSVTPWAASRCVTRWQPARADKNIARWRVKAREAAKQSRRAFLPEIGDLATTRDVAETLAACALGIVLHEEAQTRLASVYLPAEGEITVVIGPEGGVAPDELAAFESAGATAARLGATVLRASTAGLAASSVLLALSGRW